MGTSLYEQYQATQTEGPAGSLYEEYLKSQKPKGPTSRMPIPAAASESSRALPFNRPDNDVNFAGLPDNAGTAVLGTLASLPRDIPGGQAAMAGARSLVRGQPYREALSDLEEGQRMAGPMGSIARFAGAVPAAMALPGSPAAAGATFGAARGLLQASPDAGIGERVKDAAVEGAVGWGAGKAFEVGRNAVRVQRAKPLGAQEQAHTAKIKAADRVNYGAAAKEGSALPPQSVTVLQKPDVKPFADQIRASREFANADEATVLRETYKLMSRQEGGLLRRLKEQGYDAQLDLQRNNIAAAKQELLDAADQMGMPSFRTAVKVHAAKAGERDAMREGADAGKRLARGTPVAGKKLRTQSPEAIEDWLKGLPPEQAEAALQGILGRTKEMVGLQFSTGKPLLSQAVTGFGAGPSLARIARLGPALRTVDQAAGRQVPRFLRSAAVAGLTPEP